ncbi:MAG: hypothetical protein KAW12_23165 [Candidatus Aminicenantes bacterium]|nr:hypothetical protein [Candidatus Aminicenantes bacterium]
MYAKKYFLLLWIMCFLVFPGYAETTAECEVTGHTPQGRPIVKIGDKKYVAFSPADLKELKKKETDLKELQEKLKIIKKELEECVKLKDQYKDTFKKQEEYIKELEKMLELYKKLAGSYSKLKTPWVSAHFAAGMTGSFKPAVLMGLGFKKFRVYGFFQEENTGAMVGISLPLL